MSISVAVGSPDLQQATDRPAWRQLVRHFAANRFATAGLVLLSMAVLAAICAPVIAKIIGHGPNQLFPDQLNPADDLPTGPSAQFLFGVDQVGRDVFVRCLYGLRTSLIVSLAATAIATVIGVMAGMAAGYLGGWIDTVVSRGTDIFLALPVVLFAIGLSSVCSINATGCLAGTVHPGMVLVTAILALATWPYIARIARGQTLSLRNQEFVSAAKTVGAGPFRMLCREFLPNIVTQMIVYVTLIIPNNILFEAALSFLGVGIPQSTPSLGGMIANATDGSIFTYAWWMLAFPGIILLIVTVSFNVVGDGLRDAMGI